MRKTSYDYLPAQSGPWTLYRDGQEVMTGTENELWTYLHRACSSSVDHALKYEGYAIRPGTVAS